MPAGGEQRGEIMEFAEIRLILDVDDFAASVHFYRDLLGLQPVSSWEKEEGPGIILKAGGGRTIELFGPPPGASHPAQLTTAVKLDCRSKTSTQSIAGLRTRGSPLHAKLWTIPGATGLSGLTIPTACGFGSIKSPIQPTRLP